MLNGTLELEIRLERWTAMRSDRTLTQHWHILTRCRWLIQSYQLKARRRGRTAGSASNEERLPLEIWQRILGNRMPSRLKKDDWSQLLIDLCRRFARRQAARRGDQPDAEPGLEQIYAYLADLMEGKYPPDLTVHNAILLLTLFDALSQAAQAQRPATEDELVQKLFDQYEVYAEMARPELDAAEDAAYERCKDELIAYFEQIGAQQLQADLKLARELLRRPTDERSTPDPAECPEADIAGEQPPSDDDRCEELRRDPTQNPLQRYSMLPKIRNIKESLNPLQIPVRHTLEQQQLLAANGVMDAGERAERA